MGCMWETSILEVDDLFFGGPPFWRSNFHFGGFGVPFGCQNLFSHTLHGNFTELLSFSCIFEKHVFFFVIFWISSGKYTKRTRKKARNQISRNFTGISRMPRIFTEPNLQFYLVFEENKFHGENNSRNFTDISRMDFEFFLLIHVFLLFF